MGGRFLFKDLFGEGMLFCLGYDAWSRCLFTSIPLVILGVEFAIALMLLQVRHLHWGGQDQTLVSCGQDGAVYQWDVDEAKRLGEFVQKGTAYSCALR